LQADHNDPSTALRSTDSLDVLNKVRFRSAIDFCAPCSWNLFDRPEISPQILNSKECTPSSTVVVKQDVISYREMVKRPKMRVRVIGVISDTHGLIRPEAMWALAGVDLIVHAGDKGKKVLSADSSGPWFYVQLSPGAYTVKATK
jgi:hypothetical protein